VKYIRAILIVFLFTLTGETMGANNKQIKDLIKDVCVQMGDKYAKQEALDIVYATGLVESKYEYIEQIGRGPARSFWQVEPSTAVDNCKNFISSRPELLQASADILRIDPYYFIDATIDDWDWILRTNISAGILHCRIKYWRIPEPIKEGKEELAKYWKKHYNTEEGAGSVEHFLKLTEGKL
tara:strand:- start:6780 stop:7325 length:546 start_codon:yes stop_codon:yes gene_type:complete